MHISVRCKIIKFRLFTKKILSDNIKISYINDKKYHCEQLCYHIFHLRCSIFLVRCDIFHLRCLFFLVRCGIFQLRCLFLLVRYGIFHLRCSLFLFSYDIFLVRYRIYQHFRNIWAFYSNSWHYIYNSCHPKTQNSPTEILSMREFGNLFCF